MKRSFKFMLASVCIACAGIGIYSSQTSKFANDLDLFNIEALASGEITTPTDCPGGTELCAWIQAPEGTVTYYKK